MMTRSKGHKAKGKSNAKSPAPKPAGGGIKLQVGPTRPPYGSMLKAEGATGKGRMR